MKRCARVTTLSLALLLCSAAQCWWIEATPAQQPQSARRIAVLLVGFSPKSKEVQALREGLRDAGYTEGRDVALEWHSAGGEYARVPQLVADIMLTNPEVVIVESTLAVKAITQATSTIPIVIAVAADPVGSGLVDSLARPGANVTGLSMMMPDLVSKRMQLLHEFLPKLKRLGVIQDPLVPWHAKAVEALLASARSMAIEAAVVSVEKPADLDGAFSALRRQRIQALYVLDNAFFSATQRETILRLAAQSRLPATYGARSWVEHGALFSYSADFSEMFRRTAGYVDKILRGAKPGDLPIEQPRKFELVVNLKTAQALGVKVPESILVQADEVIR